MDTVTKNKRSKIMRTIKSKGTVLEQDFTKVLRKQGFRFKKNASNVCGKPDIVFRKYKLAIFVDSCFWHGCRYHCRKPKTRTSYWYSKILRNKTRDGFVTTELKKQGWQVLRFWEHNLKNDLEICIKKIRKGLNDTRKVV